MTLYAIPVDAAARLSLVTCPRPATLAADAAELDAAGVTLVVSALPEHDEIALGLADEADMLARYGIEFLRIPIEDFAVPADTEVVVVSLEHVLARLTDPTQHVAVHCLAGLGRSPLLAASTLVLSGEDADTAWRIVAAARRRPVPETPEQRAWVERLGRADATRPNGR
jgi:protein-tyrosine phosphatase